MQLQHSEAIVGWSGYAAWNAANTAKLLWLKPCTSSHLPLMLKSPFMFCVTAREGSQCLDTCSSEAGQRKGSNPTDVAGEDVLSTDVARHTHAGTHMKTLTQTRKRIHARARTALTSTPQLCNASFEGPHVIVCGRVEEGRGRPDLPRERPAPTSRCCTCGSSKEWNRTGSRTQSPCRRTHAFAHIRKQITHAMAEKVTSAWHTQTSALLSLLWCGVPGRKQRREKSIKQSGKGRKVVLRQDRTVQDRTTRDWTVVLTRPRCRTTKSSLTGGSGRGEPGQPCPPAPDRRSRWCSRPAPSAHRSHDSRRWPALQGGP